LQLVNPDLSMWAHPKPLQKLDPLDAAAEQVIAACDGDVLAAVRALIVAKGLLEAELKDVYAATPRAFSSEVGTGSREENASKQNARPSVPIRSERKRL
jgi:hypothetical protein